MESCLASFQAVFSESYSRDDRGELVAIVWCHRIIIIFLPPSKIEFVGAEVPAAAVATKITTPQKHSTHSPLLRIPLPADISPECPPIFLLTEVFLGKTGESGNEATHNPIYLYPLRKN